MHLGNRHRELVDEAPGPGFAGLDRADDRVTAGPAVRRGVAIGRVVAAADVAALQADAQVQPGVTRQQAVLAAIDGLGQLCDQDVVEVGASGHLGYLRSGLSLSVTPGAQDSARAPLKATLGKSVAPLDPLTDLANRILVLDRAEQILARARRQDVPVNALFVDIDGFKRIQRPLRPKT